MSILQDCYIEEILARLKWLIVRLFLRHNYKATREMIAATKFYYLMECAEEISDMLVGTLNADMTWLNV